MSDIILIHCILFAFELDLARLERGWADDCWTAGEGFLPTLLQRPSQACWLLAVSFYFCSAWRCLSRCSLWWVSRDASGELLGDPVDIGTATRGPGRHSGCRRASRRSRNGFLLLFGRERIGSAYRCKALARVEGIVFSLSLRHRLCAWGHKLLMNGLVLGVGSG